MKLKHTFLVFLLLACNLALRSQKVMEDWWHGKHRVVHYKPEGHDFVLVNGKQRFNRALYGSNSAFRAEAGDLPEFALYLPGMGGNLKFGLIAKDTSKWLISAASIKARYRAGTMIYQVKDPLLKNGTLEITALPLFTGEGFLVKIEGINLPTGIQLVTAYGGVTGRRFSRDGDIGADPESSFYLKPEYCTNNRYQVSGNGFTVYYGSRIPTEKDLYEIQHRSEISNDTATRRTDIRQLSGIFPPGSVLHIADAAKQQSPASFIASTGNTTPAISASLDLKNEALYFLLQPGAGKDELTKVNTAALFQRSEEQRKMLAAMISINTPDAEINTLGPVLSTAADAIWEDPSFLHGAIAWRMRLNGWRGAYAADVLGWHDRARKHFNSYALSQVTSPLTGPVVMDTALNLARSQEKLGNSLFSSGYISRNPNGDFRAHHYDMNLVFVDQLLNHFLWTGDTAYVRKMWPLLTRHLAWEKRNFDADGDGLYDAYAAIWASDALQYIGGGVTHSSSYNYRSNKMAAELAALIGEDGKPYLEEAEKILSAINSKLWMPEAGWYAEYKDLLGNQLLHPAAGLWTIYHAIDSRVHDPFQGWQALTYIDRYIPRIPIKSEGWKDTGLYTIPTTNWHPYTWSLNNVALGEVMHTALAYWQGGRSESAYKLWKSTLVESMYLGASPGNLQQLSFYDAVRGELYRDFADGIGMTARTLVEGLFGVQPDALKDTLRIQPGFPPGWDHASISTPDISFSFKRKGNSDRYEITQSFPRQMHLLLMVPAMMDDIQSIKINGQPVKWSHDPAAIGQPLINITGKKGPRYEVEITWKGQRFERINTRPFYASGDTVDLKLKTATVLGHYDPQSSVKSIQRSVKNFKATVLPDKGFKSFFIQLKQGNFSWWMPVEFNAVPEVEIFYENGNAWVRNHSAKPIKGNLVVNDMDYENLSLPAKGNSRQMNIRTMMIPGTNTFRFQHPKGNAEQKVIQWNETSFAEGIFEKVNLSAIFNDQVTNIFQHQYLSPRPSVPTLQLPTQGIGNWAYPLTTAIINDSGLRKMARLGNEIRLPNKIPFATPSQHGLNNICFTSQWDFFPKAVTIPLNGKSKHAYLLMAGTTNPMQSRMVNGEVIFHYTDGSSDTLQLKNPQNWWPIEQDLFEDGYAFTFDAPKPPRVYLKSGRSDPPGYISIKGFSNRGVDGGAATVVDLPLDFLKELKSMELKTIANDVIIGVMSLTLVRPN
jgi:hypothetical protein